MASKLPSPATKSYRVWADYVCRMYVEVEASSPQHAYELAKESEQWESCDEHDTRDYRISNDVQDLENQEFIPIRDPKNCKTCGSEIVQTINDSAFCQGECGPCEYETYKSQPKLLGHMKNITAEAEASKDGNDPDLERTVQMIHDIASLAISKAHGKAA